MPTLRCVCSIFPLLLAAVDGLAAVTELGSSDITLTAEFRFFMLNHWNLYDAMQHSNYIASRLEIWKDRTSTKLDTLLALMGIPLEQARQKYMHMTQATKDRLKIMLGSESADLRQQFNVEKIIQATFCKERKGGIDIYATDCTQICNAMLCLPPSVLNCLASMHEMLVSRATYALTAVCLSLSTRLYLSSACQSFIACTNAEA